MKRGVAIGVVCAPMLAAQGARDPGIRGGAAAAGGRVKGIGANGALFTFLISEFTQLHSVAGTLDGESGNGLGPGYNANSCGSCHAHPAIGGSSGPVNPQICASHIGRRGKHDSRFHHCERPSSRSKIRPQCRRIA